MKINLSFRTPRRGHVDADLLSAYLDAQVTPDELPRVEAHLGECAACQNDLASLRQTVTLLQALPRIPMPRAFTLAEAQVGIRRPAQQPAWLGGMLRGLAAVSAVALVAFMAATLLARPTWQPSYELARVGVSATVETVATRVQEAEAPRPQGAAPAAVGATAAPKSVAAEQTAAPTPAPAVAAKLAATSTPAPAAPKVAPATPTRQAPPAAPAPAPQPAAPAASQPTAQPAPVTPEKPAVALAAAPATLAVTPTAALAAAAGATAARSASGAGVTAAESGASPAEAARDSAALAELPPDAALAYTAAGSLWAIDRAGGVRRMAQASGLTAPIVSGDRAWIAYRQPGKDGAEIWGVPWAGGDARLLLAERELNKEASAGYQPWRFQDVRWLPGKRALAVTVSAAALAPGVAPRLELWTVEVEAGLRRLVTSSDINFRPIVAPNGATVAFFRREPGKRGEGSVRLIGTDGAGERAVLRFPLPDDQPGDDAQIGWLPDSSGFWLALPQAGTKALALYRISAAGDAQPVGIVEARQTFWSSDGARLAYTRPVSDTAGLQELYVARADGTQSRLYATLTRGRFVAWAADSARFLYEDSGQVFAGAVDQGALRLASNASESRWLGANQALYVIQPGASRQLVYQAVGGQPVVLQTLPPNTPLDGLWP